jgi:hypothetical protein
MAKRCTAGSVRISKSLALKLLDWHGGQGSNLYAVGSTGFAGRCIPKAHLLAAARELELEAHRAWPPGTQSARALAPLKRDVNRLRKLAATLHRIGE